MSWRAEPGLSGAPTESFFRGLLKAIGGLTGRVKKLESIVASGTAPADTRFEGEVDEDNVLHVYIRRISTDVRQEIGLSMVSVTSMVDDAVAAMPAPAAGADGAPGAAGVDGVDGAAFAPNVIDGGVP